MTDDIKALPYRLSTVQTQTGAALVNGRLHGFTWEPQYEVTFRFKTLAERKKFVKQAKHL